jgi:membrane-bound lytic murein transglycosylase D
VKKHMLLTLTDLYLLILLLMLAGGCSAHHDAGQPSHAIAEQIESEEVSQLTVPVTAMTGRPAFNLAAYVLPPRNLDFCGEPVPVNNREVWERFDKEFTIVVHGNAQMYLWLKRSHRDFPWLEKSLRSAGLPDDLKYLVVAETDLLPREWLSKTGNRSFFQTGNPHRDYRSAIEALLVSLKDLHRQFSSWTLTTLAYRCGEKKLLDLMRIQKTSNPYHLELPQGIETYLFRILAIKATLSHPELYGYHLPSGDGY